MAQKQEFSKCPFCGETFDNDIHSRDAGHIIPSIRGGCDHLPNLIDLCKDCNRGEGGQWDLTPLEWWAKQEWDIGSTEDVSSFDCGGWSIAERYQLLLQVAYWEARARWHLLKDHGKKAEF